MGSPGRPRNPPKSVGGFAPDLFKRFLCCPGPSLHPQSTDSGGPKKHVFQTTMWSLFREPTLRLLGTLPHPKPATSNLGESPRRLRRWSGGRHPSQEAYLTGRKSREHPDPPVRGGNKFTTNYSSRAVVRRQTQREFARASRGHIFASDDGGHCSSRRLRLWVP